MARRKHECSVAPISATQRSWKCPDCGKAWTFEDNPSTLTRLWHGNDMRASSGRRLKGFWSW